MTTSTLERTDTVIEAEFDSLAKIREWQEKQPQCNSGQPHRCSKVAVYKVTLDCGYPPRLWCQKRMEYQLECDRIGVTVCKHCRRDYHHCYKITPLR